MSNNGIHHLTKQIYYFDIELHMCISSTMHLDGQYVMEIWVGPEHCLTNPSRKCLDSLTVVADQDTFSHGSPPHPLFKFKQRGLVEVNTDTSSNTCISSLSTSFTIMTNIMTHDVLTSFPVRV